MSKKQISDDFLIGVIARAVDEMLPDNMRHIAGSAMAKTPETQPPPLKTTYWSEGADYHDNFDAVRKKMDDKTKAEIALKHIKVVEIQRDDNVISSSYSHDQEAMLRDLREYFNRKNPRAVDVLMKCVEDALLDRPRLKIPQPKPTVR